MTITTITGLIAVLLGVLYTAQSWTLPRATVGNPIGPILFPLILGGGMTILGGMLLVQEYHRIKKTQGGEKKVSLSLTMYGKSILIVTVFCIFYVALFERIGYVLSTFLFLGAVLLLFNGREKWKISVLIALCFSVGVYVLFGSVLSIQLPRMPLVGI